MNKEKGKQYDVNIDRKTKRAYPHSDIRIRSGLPTASHHLQFYFHPYTSIAMYILRICHGM